MTPPPGTLETTQLKPGMYVELQPAHQDMHPNRYRGVVQRLSQDLRNLEARYVHFQPGTGQYLVGGRPVAGRDVPHVHTGRCAIWQILTVTPPQPAGEPA